MLSGLHEALAGTSQVASIIISVAFMLLFGFAMTRITKLLKLPNVTAYILAGILIGPYCLGLIPQRIIDGMDFRHRTRVHRVQHGRILPLLHAEKERRKGHGHHGL